MSPVPDQPRGAVPMTVYVDQLRTVLRTNPRWPWPTSCHLYADSEEELHGFARKLQMRRTWFQPDLRLPHYDLTAARRERAIKAGAVEVTRR